DLDPHTPSCDVQMACGTSLEATILIADKIAMGQIESGIACGADTASDAPIALNEDLRRILLDASRARSTTQKLKALARLRPRQLMPSFPSITEPRTGLSMGQHCERMAKDWEISRQAQDRSEERRVGKECGRRVVTWGWRATRRECRQRGRMHAVRRNRE